MKTLLSNQEIQVKKLLMRNTVLCLLSVLLLFAGCFKKEDDCAPRNINAPESEVKAVEAYLKDKGIDAVKHTTGLYYKVVVEGTGNIPNICSDVRVKFQGKLGDGTIFEDRIDRDVVLNLKLTLESWRIGLPMMKTGSIFRLFVPPTLGYGSTGKADPNGGAILVPANAPIIIYDITLIEVK